jgi:hypothetical protein
MVAMAMPLESQVATQRDHLRLSLSTSTRYGRFVGTDERPDELRTKVYGERTIYDNPWVPLTLFDIEPVPLQN